MIRIQVLAEMITPGERIFSLMIVAKLARDWVLRCGGLDMALEGILPRVLYAVVARAHVLPILLAFGCMKWGLLILLDKVVQPLGMGSGLF